MLDFYARIFCSVFVAVIFWIAGILSVRDEGPHVHKDVDYYILGYFFIFISIIFWIASFLVLNEMF